jgi:hypothetical protein
MENAGIQSALDGLQKQQQRLVPTDQMLKQLRPWLEYRNITAKKMESAQSKGLMTARYELERLIHHCDKNISELLGL